MTVGKLDALANRHLLVLRPFLMKHKCLQHIAHLVKNLISFTSDFIWAANNKPIYNIYDEHFAR